MTEPRYPTIRIRLAGEDDNAFAILGRVRRALKDAQVPAAEIEAYTTDATAGDYPHLLRTTAAWVTVR